MREMNFTHLKILALGLLASIIVACSSQPRVSQDFKPGTVFSPYKTFNIRQLSNSIETANTEQVSKLITDSLEKQGFQLVQQNPDLMVDINLLKQQASQSNASLGIGLGMPIGRHGGFGISTQQLLGGNRNEVGLLIVDITDEKSHQIIWRGNANEFSLSYFFPRNQAQLKAIVEDVLAQFPPK